MCFQNFRFLQIHKTLFHFKRTIHPVLRFRVGICSSSVSPMQEAGRALGKLLPGLLTIALFFFPFSSSLSSDGLALLEFKSELNVTKGLLSSWNASDENPCRWAGVTCSHPKKRVIALNLPNRNLEGKIPSSLGRLQHLQRLALHHNKLSGRISEELDNCTELRALYLRNNYLSGEIPARLGKLSNLMILDLSGNLLTGHIPQSLGQLSRLKSLNLSNNFLSGEIPRTGVLRNFGNDSFVGNVELCDKTVAIPCRDALGFPAFIPHSENDAVPESRTQSKKFPYGTLIAVMVTVGFIFFVLILFLWLCFLLKANKLGRNYKKMGHEFKKQAEHIATSKMTVFRGDLPYNSRQLVKRIEVLGDADIIGAGGFGVVYKLVMPDKRAFAVKKISCNMVASSPSVLKPELEVLASIKHRNLLDVRGYCCSSSAIHLVYDFLPMGSLDEFLHGYRRAKPRLDWKVRLKIAIGAARGLAFLHHDCCPSIVHCDLKSSNILIDEKLEPHISDYGLAKLLEDHESHVTTIVAGTFGYIAPEYLQSGRASQKSDVYSFGVVLLELFSGKRPAEQTVAMEGLNVVGWIRKLLNERRPEDIIDPGTGCRRKESMEGILEIIERCSAAAPRQRPSMKRVVELLEAVAISASPSSSSEDFNASDFD